MHAEEHGTMLRETGAASDYYAVQALAAHLDVTPAAVVDWLQNARGVPPQVLLSWICLWDLKSR
jgi:hypothetical protein